MPFSEEYRSALIDEMSKSENPMLDEQSGLEIVTNIILIAIEAQATPQELEARLLALEAMRPSASRLEKASHLAGIAALALAVYAQLPEASLEREKLEQSERHHSEAMAQKARSREELHEYLRTLVAEAQKEFAETARRDYDLKLDQRNLLKRSPDDDSCYSRVDERRNVGDEARTQPVKPTDP